MSQPKATKEPVRILYLEDNRADVELVKASLRRAGIACVLRDVSTRSDFLAVLEGGSFDLIFTDYTLPSFDGASALALAQAKAPGCPVVFVSGTVGEEVAVEMLKQGATDYVLKDRLARLPVAVRRAMREASEQSERRRAEELLRQTKARMDRVLAHSPAVIYSLKKADPAGVPVWISENVQRLLGYGPGEVCQPDWWPENVHPLDRESALAALQQRFSRAETVCEYRIRHANGSYRWIRDVCRVVPDAEGNLVECIASWIDITEQKELEHQLRQAQKMDAIGRLAGGIAHDFNNLLAVMRGHAESLLALPYQFGDDARESLKQVVAATERAANLTRQLLTFSSKQVMQPGVLDLNELITNLIKMLGRIIGENIHLQWTPFRGLPPVEGDVGMLEQVLVNLVVNARDAMPRGGQLTIATSEVEIGTKYALDHSEASIGRFVCLEVTDTGTGILPEHLPRIFEPFFTTKEPGMGTGLGLATVYGIVKQHQGWIEVTSCIGRGTTLRSFLPSAKSPAAPAAPRPEGAIPRGGTETILLVEDDLAVRIMTRRVLENCGYQVMEAATGREALAIWRNHIAAVDLLLADIVVPDGVTGYDLAEQMQAQKARLPVVFITGYSLAATGADTDFIRRTRARFLQKPWAGPELLRCVRECLDRKPVSD